MANYTQPEHVDKRLRYFDGQFLRDQDFVDEQFYHIDRQQRQARLFLLPGVAEGMEVRRSETPGGIEVTPGTALDQQGRLIVLAQQATVPVSLRDVKGAQLYIFWQQVESDPATDSGSEGNTRWHEQPGFEVAAPGKPPSVVDSIFLADLDVAADGMVSVSTIRRQIVGIRAPGDVLWNNGTSLLSVDQGGSIELGNSMELGARPYIDFHYGVGEPQDFNVRIINTADRKLSIIGGDVGIGTEQPGARLDVQGGSLRVATNSGPELTFADEAGVATLRVGHSGAQSLSVINLGNATQNWQIRVEGSEEHKFKLYDATRIADVLVVDRKGNVGIGTADLRAKLHLHGGRLRVSESDGPNGSAVIELANGAKTNFIFTDANPGHLHLRTDSPAHHVLLQAGGAQGNVGIGTLSPGAKLSLGTDLADTKLALWDGPNDQYGFGIQNGQFRLHVGNSKARFSFLNAAAGTEIVTIQGSGNVGIGTADPKRPLHVKGNDAVLALEGSDHAYIEYYPDGWGSGRKAWLGFGNVDDNNLTISNQIPGAHIVLETNGGNVGIGTPGPQSKLHVHGGRLRVSESDGPNGNAVIELANGPQTNFIFTDASPGHLRINTDSPGHHVLLQAGGPQQGNVGIGTSPMNKLDVAGGVVIGAGYAGTQTAPSDGLKVEGTTVVGGEVICTKNSANHLIIGEGPDPPGNLDNCEVRMVKAAHPDQISAKILFDGSTQPEINEAKIRFYTRKRDQALTERMVIDADGNVGIANTAPDHLLVVGRAGGGRWLVINDIPTARWGFATGGYALAIQNDGNNGNWATRVLISKEGNVGIGTANPTSPLHIQGSGNWNLQTTEGDFKIGNNTYRFKIGVSLDGPNQGAVYMRPHGGINRLTIGGDGCIVNIESPSDCRLKHNVAPLSGALERLLQLRGVTFEWKDPATHGGQTGTQIGMIAQEVEQFFPEWVVTDTIGYKSLTIRGFEALMVEALRELWHAISEVKVESATKQA